MEYNATSNPIISYTGAKEYRWGAECPGRKNDVPGVDGHNCTVGNMEAVGVRDHPWVADGFTNSEFYSDGSAVLIEQNTPCVGIGDHP